MRLSRFLLRTWFLALLGSARQDRAARNKVWDTIEAQQLEWQYNQTEGNGPKECFKGQTARKSSPCCKVQSDESISLSLDSISFFSRCATPISVHDQVETQHRWEYRAGSPLYGFGCESMFFPASRSTCRRWLHLHPPRGETISRSLRSRTK